MPESIAGPVEPDTPQSHILENNLQSTNLDQKEREMGITLQEERAIVIWTPRFMVVFALIAVIWLSAASLLTQSWLNNLPLAHPSSKILLIETVIVLGGWGALLIRQRAGWLCVGGIFGCAWGLLTLLGFVLQTVIPRLDNALVTYLTTVPSIILLGGYACLSAHRTPLRRWDTYCMALLPLLAILVVLGLFLLTPVDGRSSENIENWIGIAARCLGFGLWWLRPSCWRAQPGVAALFGFASLLSLFLSLPNVVTGGEVFFLPQVALLCILLGLLRILQGERQYKLQYRISEKMAD